MLEDSIYTFPGMEPVNHGENLWLTQYHEGKDLDRENVLPSIQYRSATKNQIKAKKL